MNTLIRNGKALSIHPQNGPWGRDVLGHSTNRVVVRKGRPVQVRASTLGAEGCFVTALSILTQLTPHPRTPREVNEICKAGGGFLSGTGALILERAAKLVGLVAPEKLRVRELDVADANDLFIMAETIRLSLAAEGGFFKGGGACILNVDHTGDEVPDHFIACVGDDVDDGGWACGDPAPAAWVRIGPDGRGDSYWGKDDDGAAIVKHFRVWGVAPVGVALAA